MSGYIGVDLDGTLAVHEPKQGVEAIGEPIPEMVARVNKWLAEGQQVRIVTARVADRYDDRHDQRLMIQLWCQKHIGQELAVQSHKCGSMYQLWDDRAVQVIRNTGLRADEVAVDDVIGKIGSWLNEVPLDGSRQDLLAEFFAGAWNK